MFGITAAVMLFMPALAKQETGLVFGLVLAGMCFGGFLGTFPSLCAEAFGTRGLATNYAMLFVAFGVAGIADRGSGRCFTRARAAQRPSVGVSGSSGRADSGAGDPA